MSERKVFFEECRNDVAFTINEKKLKEMMNLMILFEKKKFDLFTL